MPINQRLSIKVDRQELAAGVVSKVQDCVVDQSLYIPDMFSIRFEDRNLELVDSATFDFGKSVEIAMEAEGLSGGAESSATLFKGEVTSIEPIFTSGGANFLVIRGFNKSWRAFRAPEQKTFLKQKDDEIITQVGKDFGVKSVDSTKTQHLYVAQDNQSGGEFWTERSHRTGMKVQAEGEEGVKVIKAETTDGSVATLKLGVGLKSFQPRATAAHQVDSVTVKSWDRIEKKEIVSTVPLSKVKTVPAIDIASNFKPGKTFGEAELTIVDQPVLNVTDAKAIAKGHLERLAASFIQAEGVAIGAPQIMPGKKITLKDIGTKFSGDYMITEANHVWSNQVLETSFTVTGVSTNTFSELINRQDMIKRWHGVYPGLVTDNNDPDDKYRVKVKFPWMDSKFESDWARIASPDAGPDRGFYFLPEINDEVLVAFEHGDINRPYVLGRLWNSQDAAPKPNSEVVSGGPVNERIIKSRSGHTIILDDTDGSELIKIFTKSESGGHTITLDDANKSLMIDSTGTAKIAIDGNAGSMDIETNSNITLKSDANIKLKATGNIDIDATGNVNIKGMQVSVEGTGIAQVKATNVSINGNATTEIKGGLVTIN